MSKQKKRILFFTNFLIGVQIIGKLKNYIENDGATIICFFGAIFVQKMTIFTEK